MPLHQITKDHPNDISKKIAQAPQAQLFHKKRFKVQNDKTNNCLAYFFCRCLIISLCLCVFNRLKFIHSNFGPTVHLLIAYFLEIKCITGVASAAVYSVKKRNKRNSVKFTVKKNLNKTQTYADNLSANTSLHVGA